MGNVEEKAILARRFAQHLTPARLSMLGTRNVFDAAVELGWRRDSSILLMKLFEIHA